MSPYTMILSLDFPEDLEFSYKLIFEDFISISIPHGIYL